MTSAAVPSLFADTRPRRLFVVECYWPGISAARVAAADAETRRVLEARRNHRLAAQHLGSILVPHDELLLRIFAGGSRSVIHVANVRAGIPVERTVEILALPPAPAVNK